MIIGITGGSGCGKTTLLDLIREKGGLVLDCDTVYHELLNTDEAMLSALQQRFPQAFENGVLQRKKLGAIVFQNPDALQDLNRITHSAVRKAVQERLEAKPELAAIDAIALFESGLAEFCDLTVSITAPEEDRIRRLTLRDGISQEYARTRLAAQHSPEWFSRRTDCTLCNDSTFEAFQDKCRVFLKEHGI